MSNADDREVTFLAVGDIIPNREVPESIFELSVEKLKKYDVRFGQLEINLSDRGCPSSAARTPGKAHPRNVKALKFAGFDAVSYASNHCLDWGPEALHDTLDTTRREGIQIFGAGKNLSEARQPVIIECKGVKIGMIAFNSILPAGYGAEPNKPGCNPLRVRTVYEMIEYDQPGCPARVLTYPVKEDLDALLKEVHDLKTKVDVLIVTPHWGLHFARAKIAMYQREAGHAILDAGADIIIGGHAHILKGIETYKGKAIIYSMCNFAVDSSLRTYSNLTPAQKEMVETYDWIIEPAWANTYPHPPDSRKAIAIELIITKAGIEKVALLPVMINIKAQPAILSRSDEGFDEVVKYMQAITDEGGLNGEFKAEGDRVIVLGLTTPFMTC
ncbi:MAG: CapA family protein [Chloroflexi bacterium]|nr:CapA family protein [Chloroflexota bacterium]